MKESKKDIDMSQFVSDDLLITHHKRKVNVLKLLFVIILLAFIVVTVMRFGRGIFE